MNDLQPRPKQNDRLPWDADEKNQPTVSTNEYEINCQQ
jgi:hypothetical protein